MLGERGTKRLDVGADPDEKSAQQNADDTYQGSSKSFHKQHYMAVDLRCPVSTGYGLRATGYGLRATDH